MTPPDDNTDSSRSLSTANAGASEIWVCNWPNMNGTTVPVVFGTSELGGKHFIEYSAFEKLKRERDECSDAMIVAMQELAKSDKERDTLRAEVERLEDENHKLKHDDPYFEENVRLVEGLAEANAEIKRLSGTVKCPTCGEEMDHRPDDAKAYSVLEIELASEKAKSAKLREALDQALRQWEHYMTERDQDDAKNLDHAEASLFRDYKKLLAADAETALHIDSESSYQKPHIGSKE